MAIGDNNCKCKEAGRDASSCVCIGKENRACVKGTLCLCSCGNCIVGNCTCTDNCTPVAGVNNRGWQECVCATRTGEVTVGCKCAYLE